MENDAAKNIGERIKARREALGMKRPELARRLGVEPNTLYRYEIGSIGIKDPIKEKIAQALGVSLGYLMEGKGLRSVPQRLEPEPIVPPQIYLPVLNQEACAGGGFNWSDVESEVKEWMP